MKFAEHPHEQPCDYLPPGVCVLCLRGAAFEWAAAPPKAHEQGPLVMSALQNVNPTPAGPTVAHNADDDSHISVSAGSDTGNGDSDDSANSGRLKGEKSEPAVLDISPFQVSGSLQYR